MLRKLYLCLFLLVVIHQELIQVTSSNIQFKPFPNLSPGKSIWGSIDPQYSYKNGKTNQHTLSGKNISKRFLQSITNKDQIRNYIWPWMASPQGNNFQFVNNQSGQSIRENKTLKCRLKTFDFSNPTEDLLNSDHPMDVLYPGSFVQGKKIDSGSEILQKLPISHAYRFPIRIAGNGNFIPAWSNSSEAGDVHRTIKQAIWNSKGFYSTDVYLKLVKSSQLSSLLLNINLNAKAASVLDISSGFNGDWTTKRNKFFITMLQGIADFFPDKYISDDSLVNDAVGVFLRNNFTINEAKNVEKLGYWGKGNAPCYISQVTYGRLIIISVEENERTKKLYADLTTNSEIGGLNISMKLTQIFQDSSTKVFSVGPFNSIELNDLKSGNWTNFFEVIPANSQLIQSIKPIGFRIQDFKGQNVRVTNRLQYEQLQCETKPSKSIKIQLFSIYKSAVISIKKTGSNDFILYSRVSQGNSGIFDISNQLTAGDNDQLRISNTGGRRWFLGRWQRRAILIIWIDSNKVYEDRNSCKGCHSTNDAFRCKLDKYTGSFSCWKG